MVFSALSPLSDDWYAVNGVTSDARTRKSVKIPHQRGEAP